MTMEERIERAAKDHWAHVESLKRFAGGMAVSWKDATEEKRQEFRNLLAWHLRAAFPELFSSPPTAWIAPWETNVAMRVAGYSHVALEDTWQAMRDAYLSQQVKP